MYHKCSVKIIAHNDLNPYHLIVKSHRSLQFNKIKCMYMHLVQDIGLQKTFIKDFPNDFKSC